MPFWCARLQPGRTGLALHLLQQLGYQAYYPRTRNGRGVPEGLFACYCFVGVRVQWTAVQYCPGVAHVLGTRGAPPDQVPDTLVESIQRREGPDGFILLPCRQRARPKPADVRQGDRVRVVHGPLFGRDGLCVGLSSHRRVSILLEALGKVTLPRADVRVLNGSG